MHAVVHHEQVRRGGRDVEALADDEALPYGVRGLQSALAHAFVHGNE